MSMKRREFFGVVGGVAAAWPVVARGQQPVPIVGLLRSTPAAPFAGVVTALKEGLAETGFVEGRNVVIEQRWADNKPDRLPELATELVRLGVGVIVGNQQAVAAAKSLTSTTPIVFVTGDVAGTDTERFLEESGCRWLPKPFRLKELVRVAKETLV